MGREGDEQRHDQDQLAEELEAREVERDGTWVRWTVISLSVAGKLQMTRITTLIRHAYLCLVRAVGTGQSGIFPPGSGLLDPATRQSASARK